MADDFNWLEYSERLEAEAEAAEAPSQRSGLRRLLPRLPGLPRLRRPRLPSLPSLRRGTGSDEASQRSAAELIGEREDRPLEELDERLRALRERAAAPQPAQPALYDVDELLTAPDLQDKPGGVISAVSLSKAQERQVEMLRDIVGGSPPADDRNRLPAFSLRALPRFLSVALLLLFVALPFASSDFAEGALPAAQFPAEGSGAAGVYAALDSLARGDYVLLAFEYGPAAAGELDTLAEALLRHILAKRAIPLIVGSNPIGIVHARNIITRINDSLPSAGELLLEGDDYALLRYLPGGALGTRELSLNFDDIARISARGMPTGLEFASLDDMRQIALIAESAEAIRNWAEQVLPQLGAPGLLLATGYAAQPLAKVYADSLERITGPLVGARDAYTYGAMLQAAYAPLRLDAPSIALPTVATPVPIALPTDRPTALPTALPTETPSKQDVAINPPVAAPTDNEAGDESAQVTILPQPTATPRSTNTPPPTDTPTATATEALVRVVEIIGEQTANIRRGPTTVDDILALGYPGNIYQVIGANGDSSWYQILLPSGLQAWIAAFLVEEGYMSASELAAAQASASAESPDERALMQVEYRFRLGKNERRIYQAQPLAKGDRVELALSRDRSQEAARLQAMTMGALAAIVAIALGNTIYALRGLLRRRNRGGQGA